MKLLSLRDRSSSTQGLLWATLIAGGLALTACGKKEEAAAPAAAPAAAATAGKSAAQVAVDAAKPLCQGGKTITIVWEAGLQSLDPKNFSGPKWEAATGCKVSVVEEDEIPGPLLRAMWRLFGPRKSSAERFLDALET